MSHPSSLIARHQGRLPGVGDPVGKLARRTKTPFVAGGSLLMALAADVKYKSVLGRRASCDAAGTAVWEEGGRGWTDREVREAIRG